MPTRHGRRGEEGYCLRWKQRTAAAPPRGMWASVQLTQRHGMWVEFVASVTGNEQAAKRQDNRGLPRRSQAAWQGVRWCWQRQLSTKADSQSSMIEEWEGDNRREERLVEHSQLQRRASRHQLTTKHRQENRGGQDGGPPSTRRKHRTTGR